MICGLVIDAGAVDVGDGGMVWAQSGAAQIASKTKEMRTKEMRFIEVLPG
jgi:hypothetical protein